MQILVDMNLSPQWCAVLENAGFPAHHWSDLGEKDAPDMEIFQYAHNNNYIVFTHDLDFGDILAATGAVSPSVIQIRTDDPTPDAMQTTMLTALNQFQSELGKGALMVVDPEKVRVRILPI